MYFHMHRQDITPTLLNMPRIPKPLNLGRLYNMLTLDLS